MNGKKADKTKETRLDDAMLGGGLNELTGRPDGFAFNCRLPFAFVSCSLSLAAFAFDVRYVCGESFRLSFAQFNDHDADDDDEHERAIRRKQRVLRSSPTVASSSR